MKTRRGKANLKSIPNYISGSLSGGSDSPVAESNPSGTKGAGSRETGSESSVAGSEETKDSEAAEGSEEGRAAAAGWALGRFGLPRQWGFRGFRSFNSFGSLCGLGSFAYFDSSISTFFSSLPKPTTT